jgi:hypothetical protein
MTVKLEGHAVTVSYALARTDTTAVLMYTVPAGSTIVSLDLVVATASDAGTTATVTVAKTAAGTDYLNGTDVTATGKTTSLPAVGGVGTSAQPIYGKYAETGTASTTGGPFTVICQYTEV